MQFACVSGTPVLKEHGGFCDGAQKLSICQTSGKNEEKINYKKESKSKLSVAGGPETVKGQNKPLN